jgi:hypothetical protein
MKNKIWLFALSLAVFPLSSSSFFKQDLPNGILGVWVWQKSFGTENNNYVSTPKLLGNSKKIAFNKDGTVTTYKNNIEIRISKYQISKGLSIFDQKEHDLVTFEGITYIIENPDPKKLTLISNRVDGYSSIFKK